MESVHPDIQLLAEALTLTEVVVVRNSGSGMRQLIGPGDVIGVSAAGSGTPAVGSVVLVPSDKLLMGGRVIATNAAGQVQIKSDCGAGAACWRPRETVVAYVRFLGVGGKLYPLYADARSWRLHRAIVSQSRRIEPGPGLRLVRAGRPGAALVRKARLLTLRHFQRRLRAHLCAHTQPLSLPAAAVLSGEPPT